MTSLPPTPPDSTQQPGPSEFGPIESGPDDSGPSESGPSEYWRRNLRYLVILLSIWFTVSFGFGILLKEPLDSVRIPGTGFHLGFWFAQQGSIYSFVVLIFVYVHLMNRLDVRFDVHED